MPKVVGKKKLKLTRYFTTIWDYILRLLMKKMYYKQIKRLGRSQ